MASHTSSEAMITSAGIDSAMRALGVAVDDTMAIVVEI
jgi:hypothetical protein